MVGPMGLPVDALTLEKIMQKGVDTVHTKSPFLAQVLSQTEDFNGREINWHVVVSQNNTITAMTGFDTVAINPQQPMTQARINFTNIVGTVALAFDQIAINATDAGKVDYVKSMSELAWNSLGENLGRQLYSDGTASIAGVKDMVGLQAAVNNVTGDNLDTTGVTVAVTRPGIATYAGLSRVTYPTWSSVVRNCNGPITRNKFSTMLALTVKQSKGTRPNTAVCGPITWVLLSALTIATQRNDTNPSDKRPMLSIGARAIMIDGITVIEDNLCPEGLVYFLNAENIRYATFTPAYCKGINYSITTTDEDNLNDDKVKGFWRSEDVKPLNQLAMGFQIGTSGNFMVKKPSAHSVLTNVIS
jgi:hypothetical protein